RAPVVRNYSIGSSRGRTPPSRRQQHGITHADASEYCMSAARTNKLPARQEWWSQLRVELLEITPAIWRRIIVPESITLPRLHRVLQTSMGWTNSHLHEFIISGVKYSTPDPDWSEEPNRRDERGVVLCKALGTDARCFDYIYDFGDDWHHVV